MPFYRLFSILCVFAAHCKVLSLLDLGMHKGKQRITMECRRKPKENELKTSRIHANRCPDSSIGLEINANRFFFVALFQYTCKLHSCGDLGWRCMHSHMTHQRYSLFFRRFFAATRNWRASRCTRKMECFWDIYGCIVRPRIATLSCRWMSRIADADEMITIRVLCVLFSGTIKADKIRYVNVHTNWMRILMNECIAEQSHYTHTLIRERIRYNW